MELKLLLHSTARIPSNIECARNRITSLISYLTVLPYLSTEDGYLLLEWILRTGKKGR